MTKLTYSLLSVTLAALCAAQTNNTNSTDKCLPDEFNTFEYVNATTNLTVPGFTPPGFSARNWTINFGLRDERDASGDRSFDQLLMWIDSTVGDEDLFAEDLPYTGCLLEMGMLQYKKSNGGTGEDSCKGVFSDKCYDAILEYAKSSARQEIGVKPNGQCLDMLNFVKDSCDQDSEGWGTTGSSGLLFGMGNDTCTDPGVAEGSALRAEFGMQNPAGSYGDFALYERLVTKATPMMLVAWLKNKTESGEQWGDARLLCPTPNQISPGSKAVSGAMRPMNAGGAAYVAILVSAVIFFGIS